MPSRSEVLKKITKAAKANGITFTKDREPKLGKGWWK